MAWGRFGFVVCFLIYVASAKSTGGERQGRFLRGQYTKTYLHPHIVTSWVPSSCVYIDPTLPPCRGVRFLGNFLGFGTSGSGNSVETVTIEAKSSNDEEEKVVSTSLSWPEWIGLYAPTVTINKTSTKTTTLVNQNVVVTFSLGGCQPLSTPAGLDRCHIAPSATARYLPITPTATLNPNMIENTNELTNGYNQLHGTHEDMDISQSGLPTKSLNNVNFN